MRTTSLRSAQTTAISFFQEVSEDSPHHPVLPGGVPAGSRIAAPVSISRFFQDDPPRCGSAPRRGSEGGSLVDLMERPGRGSRRGVFAEFLSEVRPLSAR